MNSKRMVLPSLRRLSPFSHGRISILWAASIVSAALLIFIDKQLNVSSHSSLEGWDWAVAAMACYSLWSIYWVRTRLPNAQVRRGRPPLPPEKRRELIQIITFAAALSIAVWSFFARVGLKSPVWFSYILYGLAVVLLLVFEPAESHSA